MNEAEQQRKGGVPLPLQPYLNHRSSLSQDDGSLFPPPDTFAAIGGVDTIAAIVDGLYDRIETDNVLRPAFGRDLTSEREKLKHFFVTWLGGPPIYFSKAWPPGLQAAHAGLAISRGMASRWLGHFLDACADVVAAPAVIDAIIPFVSRLAMALVNRPDEPLPGEPLRGSTTGADPRFLRALQQDDMAGIAAAANAAPHMLRHQGARLLLLAAVRGNSRAAEGLIRQGVAVHKPALLSGREATAHGLPPLPITPLCGALVKRRDAVVKLLVDHGAQYDIFTAAYIGDLAAVQELLAVAPELVNTDDPAGDVAGITPLMHAVYAGQLAVAQTLLQRGARIGTNGVRLLRVAANRGDILLTDLLLDHGADPTLIGPGAWTIYPPIADRLVARGADVNYEPGAWIGLCCTGNSGHKENALLARALLQYGADTAARYKGRTALHCAAKAGFLHVAQALIAYGGDVNAANARGQTPLDEVENTGKSVDRAPMRRLLLAHGARRS